MGGTPPRLQLAVARADTLTERVAGRQGGREGEAGTVLLSHTLQVNVPYRLRARPDVQSRTKVGCSFKISHVILTTESEA